jgi:hypothetical protein
VQVIQDQQGAGRAGHRAQQPPGRGDQQPPLLLRPDSRGYSALAGTRGARRGELGQQQIQPAGLPQRLGTLTVRQPLQRIVQRAGQRSIGILSPPQAAASCDAPPAARGTRGSLLQQPGLTHAWLAGQQQHRRPGPGEKLTDLRHLGVPAGQLPGWRLTAALAVFPRGAQRRPVLICQAQHGGQPIGGSSRQLSLILLQLADVIAAVPSPFGQLFLRQAGQHSVALQQLPAGRRRVSGLPPAPGPACIHVRPAPSPGNRPGPDHANAAQPGAAIHAAAPVGILSGSLVRVCP